MSNWTCISLVCPHKNRCASHLHFVHTATGECRSPEIVGDLCKNFKPTPSQWGAGPDIGQGDYE